MWFTISLVSIVVLLIILGMLLEELVHCKSENEQLSKSNDTMAQIIREANIQNVAPKKIKD